MINWAIPIISLGLAVIAFIIFIIITLKKEKGNGRKSDIYEKYFGKRINDHRMNLWYQKSYVFAQRVPFFKRYTWKIRKRLEILNIFDEYSIRRQTMKISLITFGLTALLILVFCLINNDLMIIFFIILGAVVLNGVMISSFVNRVEDTLLKQTRILYEDVRTHFQQTKNVEESIYEAAQSAPEHAAKHAERIYAILTEPNSKKELEAYYEVAPNKFYKLFTGIASLVSQFGDKIVNDGSMFLNAVSKIIKDINDEILRRDKLNYILKGLSTLAVLTVLCISPLEEWGRKYFPIMNDYYDSKLGFFTKVVFFAVVLLSYLFLKKLLDNDEARYATRSNRLKWEKKLYEKIKPLRWVVDRFTPGLHKKTHFRLTMLLKDANSPLTIEWLYLQRVLSALGVFIGAILLMLYMHHATVNSILNDPLRGSGIFGTIQQEEIAAAQKNTDFDKNVIQKLESSGQLTKEVIVVNVSQAMQMDPNDEAVIKTATRIYEKYKIIESEYFKWWELLIAIMLSAAAYHLPVLILKFQKKIRYMEMQDEVNQFHTIIGILSQFERVDVETVLEWMERHSEIFKDPIKNCLNNYSSGQQEALDVLKEDVPFESFARIVDKLKLSADKIPLIEAFDDLKMTQQYYAELRKEHFERVIEKKAMYGRILGFAPGFYLIFLYLVIPMIYLAVSESGKSLMQLKNL